MDLLQTVAAAIGLIVCVGLGVHMMLNARQRTRLDAAARQAAGAARRWAWWVKQGRRGRAEAEREAEQAIERARQGVRRDGNVYRPDAFRDRPRKPH